MAYNKFVTRKGYQSLEDSEITGSLAITGSNPLILSEAGLPSKPSEDTILVISTDGVVGTREAASSSGTSGSSGSSGSDGTSGSSGTSGLRYFRY